MPKKQFTQSGRVMSLATELQAKPRAGKSKVKARHYDHGHAIQLTYSGNYRATPPPSHYGRAYSSDAQEVRSFDARDDRFFVESFNTNDAPSEIEQHSTINQDLDGSVAAAFNTATDNVDIEQFSRINQDLGGGTPAAMAFNTTESAGENEIIQHSTINQEPSIAQSVAFNRRRMSSDEEEEETTEYAPVVEERQLWTEPAPAEEEDNSYSSQSSFEDDIKAILTGQKLYDSKSKSFTNPDEQPSEENEEKSTLKSPNVSHAHEIFDTMAKGMSNANAYDFGTLSLEKSFDEFEQALETSKPLGKKMALASEAHVRKDKVRALNDLDWAEDFSAMDSEKPVTAEGTPVPLTEEQLREKQNASTTPPVVNPEENTSYENAPAVISAQPVSTQSSYRSHALDDPRMSEDWPARPAVSVVRILSDREKARIFGQFEYEPTTGDNIRILGTWQRDNIIPVRIPQLDGKIFGRRNFRTGEGSIDFHRLGERKLVQLWQAWEDAGLLDRILSFQGGFVARYVRNTQDRNPRPLSNHAWGTAFDINAPQNGLGHQPALFGQTGCVRELVEIANQHGFFWGGHYNRRRNGSLGKDGMHFELGHPFNP